MLGLTEVGCTAISGVPDNRRVYGLGAVVLALLTLGALPASASRQALAAGSGLASALAVSPPVSLAGAGPFLQARPNGGTSGSGPAKGEDPPILPWPKHVTVKTVQAIKRGLSWLAAQQRPDGSFMQGRGGGRFTMGGSYPCTMTALAGIALLAGGNTPTRGRYARQIRRAAEYLIRQQDQNSGLISVRNAASRSMYGHGFATLFLGQVYGMGGDAALRQRLKRTLEKAVALISRAQNHFGGWFYTPNAQREEGSVTVTQLQALRACHNAGIAVKKGVIDKAINYLRISQQRDGGIAYSHNMRGSRPPLTAAALTCLYYAGAHDAPVTKKVLAYCRRRMRANWNGGHYFYTHFYLAQGYYLVGGRDWDQYYPIMRDRLNRLQQATGMWTGNEVGSIFASSIALMILQLPYENLPINEQ